MEQLADLIDGGPDSAGGRLDRTTGEVWPEFVFEESLEDDVDDDDPDCWLHVWPAGARRAYNDMLDFTATRTDQGCVTDWIARWTAAARSAGSRMCCSTGQQTARIGSPTPKTVAAVEPASGWLPRATAPKYEVAPSNPAEQRPERRDHYPVRSRQSGRRCRQVHDTSRMRPESFDTELIANWGERVLEHGLPDLPVVGARDESVPVAYWASPADGAAHFVQRSENDDEEHPVKVDRVDTEILCFGRTATGWEPGVGQRGSGPADPRLARRATPGDYVAFVGSFGTAAARCAPPSRYWSGIELRGSS